MGSEPTPKGWQLRQLPRCAVCGTRVRNDRAEKSCGRCKEVLLVDAYGHNRSRNDHRESWCRGCRRSAQRVKSVGLGKLFPLGKLASFTDGWLVGYFAGQSQWSDEAEVASRTDVVNVGYRTEADGGPVFRLVLTDVHTSEGGHLQSLAIPHTFAHLADGTELPFREGDPIIAVVEHGEVVKLIHIDEDAHTITTVVDEALFGYMFEDQPQPDQVGFPYRPMVKSWSVLRPWMMPLVLKELTGTDDPTSCVLGCGRTFRVEDGAYVCEGDCGERSADVLLIEAGKATVDNAWQVLSDLETEWLLQQAVAAVAA